MSFFSSYLRFYAAYARRLARSAALASLLSMLAASSGCTNGSGAFSSAYLGDASFGTPPQVPGADGAADEDDAANGGGSADQSVRLRFFHGVLNLRVVRVCHDPDYVLDDPRTPEDETSAGPMPAEPLLASLEDGGALWLGVPTDSLMQSELTRGAITVHRSTSVAAVPDGGPGPVELDAGALPDDAAANDGGSLDSAVAHCDPSRLEAVLPLPMEATWLDPPRPGDAGASDAGAQDAAPPGAERRGFVATASGGDALTLFGSGLSLDPAQMALRVDLAREEALKRNPGDLLGAEAAARQQRLWLESIYGPRFLLSRGAAPVGRSFALSLAHLVPDVPLAPAGMKATEPGTGALHLCVTKDGTEAEPSADAGTPRFEFRNVVQVGNALDPAAAYRFRLFVEADFRDRTGTNTPHTCGTTPLRQVAELTKPKGSFQSGKSYTLVVWGAYSPEAVCTDYTPGSLTRPGCAAQASDLAARILLFENELPER